MTKTTLDFEIIPVFNQAAPNVWNNFMSIETECDKAIYGLDAPSKSTTRRILGDYKNDLRTYKHNFAFIACHKTQMIGFTHGCFIGSDDVYLRRLYVLPTYHHCGVGSQLLQAAEQSAAIFAKNISLISLSNSTDFYEVKQGYSKFGSNMEKELTIPANTILPVFQWVKKDFNVKFDVQVDTAKLKENKFQPIFVHVNYDNKIDAVATRGPNGEKKLWSSTNKLNADNIKLLNALDKVR